MERTARNPDQPYVLRRQDNGSRDNKQYEEYDAYDQVPPSNRSHYERDSRISYYTYENPQSPANQQPTVDRRSRESTDEERVYSPARTAHQVNIERVETVVRRVDPANQTPAPPKVEYTVQQAPSTNPRTVVLDINITINVGNAGRSPQVITTTGNTPIHTSSTRSSAVLQDVGYVDLDLRAPERTARLVTDGFIRSSPPNPAGTYSNNYVQK